MRTTQQRIDERFELTKRILDNTEAGDILWEQYLPNSWKAEWNGLRLRYEALQDDPPTLFINGGDMGESATIRSRESDSISIALHRLDLAIRAQHEDPEERASDERVRQAAAARARAQEDTYVEKLLTS